MFQRSLGKLQSIKAYLAKLDGECLTLDEFIEGKFEKYVNNAIQTLRYSLSPRNNKHPACPVQKLIWLSKLPNIASFITCELNKLFRITCFLFCDSAMCLVWVLLDWSQVH